MESGGESGNTNSDISDQSGSVMPEMPEWGRYCSDRAVHPISIRMRA